MTTPSTREPLLSVTDLSVTFRFGETAKVHEPHRFALPRQIHDPCRTASMFGDHDFRQARLIFWIIGIGTVQKHHHIRVLFDGATFT